MGENPAGDVALSSDSCLRVHIIIDIGYLFLHENEKSNIESLARISGAPVSVLSPM